MKWRPKILFVIHLDWFLRFGTAHRYRKGQTDGCQVFATGPRTLEPSPLPFAVTRRRLSRQVLSPFHTFRSRRPQAPRRPSPRVHKTEVDATTPRGQPGPSRVNRAGRASAAPHRHRAPVIGTTARPTHHAHLPQRQRAPHAAGREHQHTITRPQCTTHTHTNNNNNTTPRSGRNISGSARS